MIRRAFLYARTARHLEPAQIAFQLMRRLQGHRAPPETSYPPVIDDARAKEFRGRALGWGAPGAAASVMATASALRAGRFTFVGSEFHLSEPDWSATYVSRLWTYNLHYFDYARTLAWASHHTGDPSYAARFSALARSWIASTPSGGSPAWDAYPISLRVVNWLYALAVAGDAIEDDARHEIIRSIHRQLRHLEQRLELHILGNHLIKNIAALALGGVLFQDDAAKRWLSQALSLLEREVPRQVNDDGGHVERSPMYHAIVMADLLETLDILGVSGAAVSPLCRDRVSRMATAHANLTGLNGHPRLFNDSAAGIAPSNEYLDRLNRRVFGNGVPAVVGLWSLPTTGFHGWVDDGNSIAIDAGIPSPAYQPAHAHCSALSFELAVDGRAVVVDAGVHGYDGDPFREYSRSTRAHNTVMISGRDQSEMWGTFRVARRASVGPASLIAEGKSLVFRGSCSPYHDRRARHHREIQREGQTWTISDVVEGAAGARLDAFLHLHPDANVLKRSGGLLANLGDLWLEITPFGYDDYSLIRGEMEPVQGWYCPRFGEAYPSITIAAAVHENRGAASGFHITRTTAP